MSEIPKESLEKAKELLGWCTLSGWAESRDNVARYIADVSEKAKTAVEQSTFAGQLPAHISPLQSLILPNPEDDLLKEAREIAKVGGYEEDEGVVQIIARGIEHGRQGRK